MSKVRNRCVVAALAAFFPIAAFADISGTLTVAANTNVNMDTAATVSSGGDFSWNGTTLTPQGSAKAYSNAAISGATTYGIITQSLISSEASLGSSSPISGLAANSIVLYGTTGGNFGKLLVTSVTGGSLVFQYTTYESAAPNTPTITGIQNNYSLLVPGLPNYGISPGTLFIIRGTNLASVPVSSISALQSSAAPGIPSTLNGAQITVTVGSFTGHPGMYYAGATQIAAVLPSATPVGTGTITVSYGGATSNAATLTVVTTALGLDTYYGTGSGLGVATDAVTGALITYTNSAKPGEPLVLWGSGAGADTADSDTVFTSTPHAVSTPLTLYIGGVQVTPSYQGSSGYPGLNQINFTVPANAATGCGVTVAGISNNTVVTNTIQLPIEPTGGVCSDAALGYNGTTLQGGGSTSGTYTSAGVTIIQSTTPVISTNPPAGGLQTIGTADFTKTSGTTTVSGTGSVLSLGNCYVAGPSNATGTSNTTSTGLDAGTITISGPAGSQALTEFLNPLTNQPIVGTYEMTLANSFIPANGGTFTASGAGGKDVGSFTATVTLGPTLQWTNQTSDATVNRANGIPITWTGGSSSTYVYIAGTSSSSTGSATGSFFCYVPASADSFTVPNYIALALPAGTGSLSVGNVSNPASFTASGLTSPGYFLSEILYGINATYQ
ncbi:MAG TPA: hypothetical protein VK752_32765 [Bryobacteraceae bacterium]|nr:hypothetical protein [Bryobacteraceae bacterium]